MSQTGDNLRDWREAVLHAADDLEEACGPLLSSRRGPRDIPDSSVFRRERGTSWVPHVEAILDLAHNLRHVAGDGGLDQMIEHADREVA
jgi:hypothetical protein